MKNKKIHATVKPPIRCSCFSLGAQTTTGKATGAIKTVAKMNDTIIITNQM